MRQRAVRIAASAVLAAALSLLPAGASLIGGAAQAKGLTYSQLTKFQRRSLSGFAALELNPASAATATARARAVARARPGGGYFPSVANACADRIGADVKVNQNCQNLTDPDVAGRAQAQNETSIAANPNNPAELVASQNDYRRGDGNCYGAYSRTRGALWQDTTVPMGFTRGTAFGGFPRQYWEAGGDTSVAWDTKGNVYFSCQQFNRGLGVANNPDQSSAFYLYRSTQNKGASWDFTGRPIAESNDVAGSGAVLLDKQLMTVDNHRGSPFQDRIYVTWTLYAADGTAYIYGNYSADYGEHFSAPVLISSNSPLCTAPTPGAGTPNGNCNNNSFSQPFTGPDGALYVVWANYNTPATSDNRYQMLLARSTDGGASFSAPVKAGDYYELPDCPTYQQGQDPGRACVPEKGATANSIFRAANYPSGAVNPRNPRQVVVTFGSYVNRDSNESNGCAPAGRTNDGGNLYTGVKTAGACNNDIVLSVSDDAGASFTGGSTDPRRLPVVTQARQQATTDQWFQWADFTGDGRLAVSYYDRQYGSDEATGFSDFSVSGSQGLRDFGTVRATGSPMPPPTQFGGVFWGDYTGMTAAGGVAHPVWSDTRNPELFLCPGTGTPGNPPAVCTQAAANAAVANDQELYTASVGVPSH